MAHISVCPPPAEQRRQGKMLRGTVMAAVWRALCVQKGPLEPAGKEQVAPVSTGCDSGTETPWALP